MEDEILTSDETARYLRVSVGTLEHWRAEGGGPDYARIGKYAMYRKRDLDDWFDKQKRC